MMLIVFKMSFLELRFYQSFLIFFSLFTLILDCRRRLLRLSTTHVLHDEHHRIVKLSVVGLIIQVIENQVSSPLRTKHRKTFDG